MSLLLGKDEILLVNRRLAALIGLNEAIVLQQLHYWLRKKTGGIEHAGERWIFNSLERWREQFPFWSVDTVKRALSALKSKGLIRVEKLAESSRDQTNYYTIDYAQIALLEASGSASCNGAGCPPPSVQIAPMEEGKLPPPSVQVAPPHGANCTDGSVQVAPMTNKRQRLQQRLPKSIAGGADAPPAPMIVTTGNGVVYEIPGELRYPGPATKSHKAWIAYAIAYHGRYKAWPIWNATVGGQISQLIDRVGAELAPRVAVHYVRRVNEEFVVRQMHPVKLLMSDAEKWATQLRTGASTTATHARQVDKGQAAQDTVAEAMEILNRNMGAGAVPEGQP